MTQQASSCLRQLGNLRWLAGENAFEDESKVRMLPAVDERDEGGCRDKENKDPGNDGSGAWDENGDGEGRHEEEVDTDDDEEALGNFHVIFSNLFLQPARLGSVLYWEKSLWRPLDGIHRRNSLHLP